MPVSSPYPHPSKPRALRRTPRFTIAAVAPGPPTSPTPRQGDPPPSPTPLDRLTSLLSTITSVLEAYSALPARAPACISSLHEFQHRALLLLPEGFLQSPFSRPAAMQPGRRPSYSHASSAGDPNPCNQLTMSAVEKLEKEWWSSEVVAAWYGPRPGAAPVSDRMRKDPRNALREDRLPGLKRDTSYVGLHDE